MKQEFYRNISLIAYEESLPENWQEELSTFEDYAYILHDKDLNKDGSPKKKHYHIAIWFGKQIRHNSVEKLCEECFGTKVFQALISSQGLLRYFQHKDNVDKEPYSEDLIVASKPFSEFVKTVSEKHNEDAVGCYKAVREALEQIEIYTHCTFLSVADYILENYPQHFSEFQSRAYFYRQIIDGVVEISKIY